MSRSSNAACRLFVLAAGRALEGSCSRRRCVGGGPVPVNSDGALVNAAMDPGFQLLHRPLAVFLRVLRLSARTNLLRDESRRRPAAAGLPPTAVPPGGCRSARPYEWP